MLRNSRSRNFRPVILFPGRQPGLFTLGCVAAGIPLEAIEDRQRSELQTMLTSPGRYALRVGDDSMCEAGILAGDIVVIQSQQQAANGDLVVALLDGEQVILKRIRYLAGKRIQLMADNSDDDDQILEASRVFIQGRVIGQVRSYR